MPYSEKNGQIYKRGEPISEGQAKAIYASQASKELSPEEAKHHAELGKILGKLRSGREGMADKVAEGLGYGKNG